MNFYQDLYCGSKVSPQETPPDAFTAGKAAMLLGGTWNVGAFDALSNLQWTMVPHPYFKTPVTPSGSFHVAVNKNSAHPAEAVEFLKFLTGEERTVALTTGTNEIPARKSAYTTLASTFASPPNSIFAYELAHTAVSRPRTPAYGAMEDILKTSFNSIITCADVKGTLNDAVTKIDAVLAKP
jgi:multiple sugar transport system substrate-binding protein